MTQPAPAPEQLATVHLVKDSDGYRLHIAERVGFKADSELFNGFLAGLLNMPDAEAKSAPLAFALIRKDGSVHADAAVTGATDRQLRWVRDRLRIARQLIERKLT